MYPETYRIITRDLQKRLLERMLLTSIPHEIPQEIYRRMESLAEKIWEFCKSVEYSFSTNKIEEIAKRIENLRKELLFFDIPTNLYSSLSTLLEVFSLEFSGCFRANLSAIGRYLAIREVIKNIKENCKEIVLYLEGNKMTPYLQILKEIPKEYENVKLDFIDRGSRTFENLVDLVEASGKMLLKCYREEKSKECTELRKVIEKLQREREKEWIEKIGREKGCIIVVTGYEPPKNLTEELKKSGKKYKIITVEDSILFL
jgi:type III secretion system FlhB-like substrate exporter